MVITFALIVLPSVAAILLALTIVIFAHGMFTIGIGDNARIALIGFAAICALSILCGAWLLCQARRRG